MSRRFTITVVLEFPFSMRLLDLLVIFVYLIAITWFGARFRHKQKTLKDYFLGGRTAPWWAISLSIVSAETSTLTVIGTPALAFQGNLGFLQVVFGYLLARVIICLLFLPHYFRGEMYTAYELIRRRFGPRIQRLTAAIFLMLRALAEGVRVFAISIVISVILNAGELASIFLIVCLTLFYTFEGGMTAVIWTDVVQMFLYIAGALVSFFCIVHMMPGGLEQIWRAATQAEKLRIFDFRFDFSREFFSRTYSFWAGLIGGCFLTTASHGTEQLIVQRLLAARNLAESRLALLSSWLVIFFQFGLFLLIGVALYALYSTVGLVAPQPADRIYPEFVWRHLPSGVAGLVVSAILAAAMSNMSAALNALASTSLLDFYWPFFVNRTGQVVSHTQGLYLARTTTILWGGVLLLIGWIARKWGSVLEAGLSIASVLYGSLLGTFLLGLLTRRAGEKAAAAAVVAGVGIMIYVRELTKIAWTWYVPIGTCMAFTVGALVIVFDRKEQNA